MSATRQTGRCACGAVHFEVAAPKTYGACHCEMCRRWAGGVWMGVVADEEPEITGEIAIWPSSKFAERAFCPKCGSNIWHRPKGGSAPTMGQGLFDDQTGWTRTREIFDDDRPDHYAFGAPAAAFTGVGTIIAYLLGRLPK